MKFKRGDKVKFLNERGGGVISKIINPSLVHVTIEDGFDIPVLPSELIKIEEEKVGGRGFFNEDPAETMVPETPPAYKETEEDEQELRTPLYYGKNAVTKGVYLAFVPEDQKFLISGKVNMYILNNTPYDVLYSLFTKTEDRYVNKDYDTVFAEHKTLIDSIEREDLPNVLEGAVQMLFQQDTLEQMLMPVHAGYKVQGSKFYQENAIKKSQMINELAIVVSLTELAEVQKVEKSGFGQGKDKTQKTELRKRKPQKPQALIDRHKTGPREAEVDLHISGLRDDFNSMEKGEILNYQLSYFGTTLESAMLHQYNNVVYIHGIGNGTLKNELRKKIKEEYPDLLVRNAPFTRYGNGAIEVLIQQD